MKIKKTKELLEKQNRKEVRILLGKLYPDLSYNAISILISKAAKEMEEKENGKT